MKEFDLNIGKILENWEIYHAIREIIANALDEQILTNTPAISIYKLGDMWCVRDYGRGLSYHHLMQNENPEKTENDNVIGRFGVGLKDALATLYRHGIRVEVQSKFGTITLKEATKSTFDDIVTLHAQIDEPVDDQMQGTAFCLFGCPDKEIDNARRMFLRFSDERVIEQTTYGQIIAKSQDVACIYINGVKVAEEPNFAFSYNITSLSKQIKKALNRERTNVGRTAYADRIKFILLEAKSDEVIDELCEQLECLSDGTQCDEIKWIDVASYVVKTLNDAEETVFVTPDEIANSSGSTNEILQNSGKRIVFVPESVKKKVERETDEEITTIQTVVREYNDSFSYDFVDTDQLTEIELTNWKKVSVLLEKLELSSWFDKCLISEKLKEDPDNTVGVWDRNLQKIIILRSQLQKEADLLGTVMHEIVHAQTGAADVSRYFECELTKWIGKLAARYILNGDNAQKISKKQITIDFGIDLDSTVCRYNIDMRRLALLSMSGDVYWCNDCFGLLSAFTKQLLKNRNHSSSSKEYKRKCAVYLEEGILYWLVYNYSSKPEEDFLYVITVDDIERIHDGTECVIHDGEEIALLRNFMTIKPEITLVNHGTAKTATYDRYLQVNRELLLMVEKDSEEDIWELAESIRREFDDSDEDLKRYIHQHICPVCGCYYASFETECIKCGFDGINLE